MKRAFPCLLIAFVLLAAPRSTFAQETTCGGYVFALTEAQLDRAVELVSSGDEAAFQQYVQQNSTVGILKKGVQVYVEDRAGFLGMTKVKVRPVGKTISFWTLAEAVQKPCKRG